MLPYRHALIFTGHMVDTLDRSEPRFPASMVPSAQAAIRREIDSVVAASGGSLIGIASGARGGDILFLESLKEKGLPFRMVLPFKPETFLDTSLRGVSPDWEMRFWSLWNGLAPEDREDLGLPVEDESYAACNARMLERARGLGQQVGLLALWDRKDTKPLPGGTAHFIQEVRAIDGQITIIYIGDLTTRRG